jgi:hypothetical protein
MKYSRTGLIITMMKYTGMGPTRLLEYYIKKDLKIDGEISEDDGLALMDIQTKEEASYAVRKIKRKYGRIE